MIPSDVLEKALNNTTLAARMGAVEQKVLAAAAGAFDGTDAAQQISEYRTTPDFPKTRLPEIDKLYEAVSDATWNDSDVEDEHWEVVVQRVYQDGTLDADSEVTKRAVGVEEDGAPVTAGDRCFELVTGEGRRVGVPIGGPAFPWTKTAFGYSLVYDAVSGDTVCTIRPGQVIMHPLKTYSLAAATDVTLSGTYAVVHLVIDRVSAGTDITIACDTLAVSDGGIMRIPLYTFKQLGGGGYELETIHNMGDVNFAAPVR